MVIQSFIFLLASIVGSALILFASYKIFKKAYLNILGVGENINLASSLLLSSLLLSIGLHTAFAMGPFRNLLALLKSQAHPDMIQIAGYFGLFTLLAVLFSFMINFSCYKFFDLLTPEIDEAQEIRENNVPVALIVSTIILVTVFISKEAFIMLLEAMVPYPPLNYR